MTRSSRLSETETAVVVDVGATRTEAGYGGWHERNQAVRVEETPMKTDGLVAGLRSTVGELVEEARSAGRDVSAVAVGVPGLVDHEGRLVEAPHTSFGSVDLSDELAVDLPLAVENDANAQALGCSRILEHASLCYVALGTGIGGGIVESGEVVRGANGFAGEVGHMRAPVSTEPQDAHDGLCECGRRGCLETVASGDYLLETLGDRWWKRELPPDEERVVKRAGEAVGNAASQLAVLNDPESVVVTGKLTAKDVFVAGMRETYSRPWVDTDCPLKTHEHTWRFAREGLTEIARRAAEKSDCR